MRIKRLEIQILYLIVLDLIISRLIFIPNNMGSLPVQQPYRILIAGGAYGGVSAAVNLLDLSLGRSARLDPDKAPAKEALDGVPIEIHIVDERDGYCKTASHVV